MWTVVIFVKENAIETIPLKWLLGSEGNLAYWPAVKGVKLNSMIVNCAEPLTSWEIFEIRFPSNTKKIYDNFLKARKACSMKTEESDVISEGDCPIKRSRKTKKFIDSSDEEDSDFQSQLPNPPALPDKSFVSPSVATKSALTLQTRIDEDISSPTSKSTTKDDIVDCISDVSATNTVENLTHSEDTSYDMSSTSGRLHETPKNPKNKQDTVNQFDNRILRQLVLLNHKVDLLSSDVTKILEKITTDDTIILEDTAIENYFPLKTEEELNDFEMFLSNERNLKKFIQYVTKLGGATLPEAVRRTMERLIVDDFLQQYSWLGQKQKKVFGVLKIAQGMKDGIKRNKLLSDTVTESSVECCMKNWMRHAKDRIHKRSRKAAMNRLDK